MPYPNKGRIVSAIDFNTTLPDAGCAAGETIAAACVPDGSTAYAPPGWPDGGYLYSSDPTLPPLDGHFVSVATILGGDNYVYLFGIGPFQASWVYLARLPASSVPNAGAAVPYLKDVTGFQIWTTAVDGGGPGWSSGSPPTATEVANAAPLFTDTGGSDAGDVGILSVQSYATENFSGVNIWFIAYNRSKTNSVWFRWIVDPTTTSTPWSAWNAPVAAIDTHGGSSTYCCNEEAGTCTGTQVLYCKESAFYAPELLSESWSYEEATGSCSVDAGVVTATTNYPLYYLLSSATPAPTQATLMTLPMTFTYSFAGTSCPDRTFVKRARGPRQAVRRPAGRGGRPAESPPLLPGDRFPAAIAVGREA